MVTIEGQREPTEDEPLHVTVGLGSDRTFSLRVSGPEFEQLLDVLERIQQQLASINNGNNLEPGERFHG